MERYLPGAIRAACGVAVYVIGCVLFLACTPRIDIAYVFAFATRLPPHLPPPLPPPWSVDHSPSTRRRCSSRILSAMLFRDSRTSSANGAFGLA